MRVPLLSAGEPRDVPEVCALGQSAIEGHVLASTLHRRMARQPDVLTCVRAAPDGPILGYSIAYWLTGAAFDRILSGAIQSGADLTTEDLARPSEPVAACYLGMIWRAPLAYGSRGPSPTTTLLLSHLHDQCRRRAVTVMVARPASPAGRRLLESLCLRPIGPEHELWIGRAPRAAGNG
jgi:hypothetical protein